MTSTGELIAKAFSDAVKEARRITNRLHADRIKRWKKRKKESTK